MTISISISDELIKELKAIAEQEHRSLSGQVSFFCAEGVRRINQSEHTDIVMTTPQAAYNNDNQEAK